MRPATRAVIVALMAVTACGVPTDESAQEIALEQLPEPLRPGVTTTTTTIAGVTETATVYLLETPPGSERRFVVDVTRDVPLGATIQAVLSPLFGPEVTTPEEEELGYSNALFELSLLGAMIDGEVGVIDIVPLTPEGEPSEEPFTGDLIGAAAQLVFTATELVSVTGVQILINGEEVPIPTNDPDTAPGAILDRTDYELFDPSTEVVTPTTSEAESTTTSVAEPDEENAGADPDA